MYHIAAREAKKGEKQLFGKQCPVHVAHNAFTGAGLGWRNSDSIKRAHGPHCALYDVYELYLHLYGRQLIAAALYVLAFIMAMVAV